MSRRVLVVEDDLDIRESLVDTIVEQGFECTTAANGQQALEVLKNESPPDVILLDLMMPVMDGRAFLDARDGDPRIAAVPVVVLSAYRDLGDVGERNVVAALRKPVALAELTRVLKDILSKP